MVVHIISISLYSAGIQRVWSVLGGFTIYVYIHTYIVLVIIYTGTDSTGSSALTRTPTPSATGPTYLKMVEAFTRLDSDLPQSFGWWLHAKGSRSGGK